MSSSEKLRGTADEGRVFSTAQQVLHAAARMEPVASRAEREGVPMVLIGHSIGAYIALEAVLQAGSSPSASPRIPLLTPFSSACERRGAPVSLAASGRHQKLGWLLTEPAGWLGACSPASAVLRKLLAGSIDKMSVSIRT